MRVLNDNVLVEQDPPSNQRGLLFVPDSKEEYPNMGTVRGVGPDVQELAITAGTRVIFKRKPDSALVPEGRPGEQFYGLLVLPEDNILAVIEGD